MSIIPPMFKTSQDALVIELAILIPCGPKGSQDALDKMDAARKMVADIQHAADSQEINADVVLREVRFS